MSKKSLNAILYDTSLINSHQSVQHFTLLCFEITISLVLTYTQINILLNNTIMVTIILNNPSTLVERHAL